MYILCETKWGRPVRFTQWVQTQTDRDDAVGELARRVPDWPRGRPKLDRLHEHIEVVGADGWDLGEAHRAVELARCEWKQWRWPDTYGCRVAA
jgi:hypothetical protein